MESYNQNNNPRFLYTPYDGNWEFNSQKLKVLDLTYICDNMLTEDRLKTVKLKEIAWRGKHHFPYNLGVICFCCGGIGYVKCDPVTPGIIAYNCPNPFDNKYRMLDGRHRITEMKKDGMASSKFYVISKNELYPYIHTEDDAYRTIDFRKKILSLDKSWINN